ncbi:hypothetical protein PIB30_009895 [Stylosanthes scabra]|uniref:Uncharacterized protein n=1 Tax=Stylosanthes scabra TaxID=79078 RepID=A0ABU6S5C7_9FABA|nr:hypothetical protein [Stylosanthes scabra]
MTESFAQINNVVSSSGGLTSNPQYVHIRGASWIMHVRATIPQAHVTSQPPEYPTLKEEWIIYLDNVSVGSVAEVPIKPCESFGSPSIAPKRGRNWPKRSSNHSHGGLSPTINLGKSPKQPLPAHHQLETLIGTPQPPM